MNRYECTACSYVYAEEKGEPSLDIEPGTRFGDLPDNWACPQCGAPKSLFEKI